ncbi:MAG TPA: hypothetical protein VKG26_06510 [Bacteroidia bacterium]|nr:hypothetical protein [Bacteroidia bacterium]
MWFSGSLDGSADGKFLINVVLTQPATTVWTAATQKLVGKYLVFIVEDNIIMIPQVSAPITDSSMLINGNFTEEQMIACYKQIKSSMDEVRDK